MTDRKEKEKTYLGRKQSVAIGKARQPMRLRPCHSNHMLRHVESVVAVNSMSASVMEKTEFSLGDRAAFYGQCVPSM